MTETRPIRVAIIGGGPAGLMAAEVVAAGAPGVRPVVTVYERMPTVGRRLLMAGRGGLNLTHGEELGRLLQRYGARREALAPAIEALPPPAVRSWCEALGEPTFVGSSGRVFPRAMKSSPLLRAWLRRLAEAGVGLATRHRWRGWDAAGGVAFETPGGEVSIEADAIVLALGGASWPTLGADPGWVEVLRNAGVDVRPLQPANCGFLVAWSERFRARFEGHPLKRIGLSFAGETVRGEALITAAGIEGGAVYALAGKVRDAVAADGQVRIEVDLRPDLSPDAVAALLDRPRGGQSLSSVLRKALRLPPVAIGLLQEAAHVGGYGLSTLKPGALAALVRAVPLTLIAPAPVERAISSAGGVAFEAIDGGYMLSGRPGVFVAGEMLDWEAPTGGYLLQASLATGAAAGRGVLAWLTERAS